MPRKRTVKISLSQAAIATIKPPKSGRLTVHDTKAPGLCVVTTAAGAKAFYLYRWVENRPLKMKIGGCDKITVEQARTIIREKHGEIAKGADPMKERQERRRELTLAAFWEQWWPRHKRDGKKGKGLRPRTAEEYERNWERHIKPHLGGRRLSELNDDDAQDWYDTIRDRSGNYAANRALALLSVMYGKHGALKYARPRFDKRNPCETVTRSHEQMRERFLLPEELPAFIKALNAEKHETIRDCIAMMLWTGQRRRNVQAMRWNDLDLKRRTWIVPGETLKNGQPLQVHLSEPAITILLARQTAVKAAAKEPNRKPRASDASPYVFPGRIAGTFIQEPKTAWKRITTAAGLKNLRLHDLRHTYGSWQAMTGAGLPQIGAALGHRSEKTTARYAHLTNASLRPIVDAAATAILAAAAGTDDGEPLAKIG